MLLIINWDASVLSLSLEFEPCIDYSNRAGRHFLSPQNHIELQCPVHKHTNTQTAERQHVFVTRQRFPQGHREEGQWGNQGSWRSRGGNNKHLTGVCSKPLWCLKRLLKRLNARINARLHSGSPYRLGCVIRKYELWPSVPSVAWNNWLLIERTYSLTRHNEP